MPKLRDGSITNDRRLDRLKDPDDKHLRLFPFTAARAAEVGVTAPQGSTIGIDWHRDFGRDALVKGRDGRWRVPKTALNSPVEGGHAIFCPQKNFSDATGWHPYYDQGREGRCVQFAISRMMSHFNRKRYAIQETDVGRWLYWEAQKTDSWPGGSYPGASPRYEGTSVRAGLEIVRTRGIIPHLRTAAVPADGISAYRWALSIDDWLAGLGRSGAAEVPWLNSWGAYYPRVVYVPVDEVFAPLLEQRDGDFAFVTDR